MARHIITGIKGEKLAVEYLVSKNYIILEKNWRSGHKEIDIIAQKGNLLVIAEVKTRRRILNEMPYEAVTEKKQQLLIEATEAYVNEKDVDFEIRYDIISIFLNSNKTQIEHIKNAFTPLF